MPAADPTDSRPPDPPPGSGRDTGEVVLLYKDMVYGIALTHTRCKGDADDVFQEVFLTYHRKQPSCRGEGHRKAWLITTTLTCAKRMSATSWRTKVVPMAPEDAEKVMAPVFHFATDEQDAIFRAMGMLPPDYRTALHLHYFEDMPIARIAETLGIEQGAVKMRLSRGRGMMRERLQGDHFNER